MKTPPAVQGWKLPGWATPHNLALIAGGIAAAVVIILLARAVGRLAKLARVAAAPVAAPDASGVKPKHLLLAAAAIGGIVLLERHKTAATAVKAAPAPSPSPSPTPRPTVTQTVAPHVTGPAHHLLTGGDIVALYVIAAVVAIVLVGHVLRRSS